MTTYIALFRGINVGGRHILRMKELVLLLQELGLEDVRTYIQSGNAVFRSPPTEPTTLAERIRSAIESQHGFRPEVLLLTLGELENVVRGNPFPEAAAEPITLHVSFLASTPENPDLRGLQALVADRERFELHPNALYLHAPDGIGRSRVAASVERLLGVAATARNWRTVSAILALAKG